MKESFVHSPQRDPYGKPFIHALRDYSWLLNRGYPERPGLQLVGDRFRLIKEERLILYRGVSSEQKAKKREQKRIKGIDETLFPHRLHIDGYNVIFTILNYRLGKPLFLSADTFLRDAGGLHGRIKSDALFREMVDYLLRYFQATPWTSFQIYLDQPLAKSRSHAGYINRELEKLKLPGKCLLHPSVDLHLKNRNEGIIATADSAIIDQSGVPVLDLAREVLESRFQPRFLDLRALING